MSPSGYKTDKWHEAIHVVLINYRGFDIARVTHTQHTFSYVYFSFALINLHKSHSVSLILWME